MKNLFNKVFKQLKELGKLTPVAFLTAIMPIIGGTILLIYAVPLGAWLREDLFRGIPTYFFGMLILCGLSILTTNIIATLGGWSFGFEVGTVVLMLGIIASALLSYFINSRIAGDKLLKVFAKRPKAEAVYQALLNEKSWRTTLIIFLLRLSPAFPFGLTNFLLASARVSIKSFLIGTFFGMLPRSSALAFVGSQLAVLDFNKREDSQMVIFGIIATVICVIVISIISKRALMRLTMQQEKAAVNL